MRLKPIQNVVAWIYTVMTARLLHGSGDLPQRVRVNGQGQVSIVDVIMNVSFTRDDGTLTKAARQNALTYYERLRSDHPELTTQRVCFKFPGRGQQDTPVACRGGILQIIQLLKGKKAAKFRHNIATLLEKYLDADMGLADDITDRALDAHMASLQAAKSQSTEEVTEKPRRLRSRDSTKEMGEAIKQTGANPKYYGLVNGGVNRAVTGMYTKAYRDVQVNLLTQRGCERGFHRQHAGDDKHYQCFGL